MHLSIINSDHAFVFLNTYTSSDNGNYKSFKLEAKWLLHDDVNLFKGCKFAITIWTNNNYNCPTPMGTNNGMIDWVVHIWKLRNTYYKLFDHPLKQNLYYSLGNAKSP